MRSVVESLKSLRDAAIRLNDARAQVSGLVVDLFGPQGESNDGSIQPSYGPGAAMVGASSVAR